MTRHLTLWDRLWRWLDRHARAIQDDYAPGVPVTRDTHPRAARRGHGEAMTTTERTKR